MDRTDNGSKKTQSQQTKDDIAWLKEQGIVSQKKGIFTKGKPSLERANSMDLATSPDNPAGLFPPQPPSSSSKFVLEQSASEELMLKIVKAPTFESSFQKLSQKLFGKNITTSLSSSFSRAQDLVSSIMAITPKPSEKADVIQNEDDLLAVTAYFAAINAEKRLSLQQEAAIRESMTRVIDSIPKVAGISSEAKNKYRQILSQLHTALCENMDLPYPKDHQPDSELPARGLLTRESLLVGKRLEDNYPEPQTHSRLSWDDNPQRKSFDLSKIYGQKDETFSESVQTPLQREPINKSFVVAPGHQEEARDLAAQSKIGGLLKTRGALFSPVSVNTKSQIDRGQSTTPLQSQSSNQTVGFGANYQELLRDLAAKPENDRILSNKGALFAKGIDLKHRSPPTKRF